MKACTVLVVAMMACLTAPIFAQFPGGPGQCNTGCCNLGNTVLHGACSSFAAYFKNDADTAINEDNYNFGKRVANAPTPSDRCCIDGRAFVQSGCSCNQSVKDAASPQGYSANAIAVIGRAVTFSICTNSQHGGGISTGGC